jgi:hypothetical protein
VRIRNPNPGEVTAKIDGCKVKALFPHSDSTLLVLVQDEE